MREFLRASRSPWLATPLIALAVFVSLWSLTSMVVLGGWMRKTAVVLLLVALVVVVVRMLSRSKLVPTLIGLLTGAFLLIAFYAKDDTGGGHLLPTPSAFKALLKTFEAGVDYAQTASDPAPVSPALASLFTAGIVGLFLVAECIAVSWRAVATSGLLLFSPWIPAIVLNHRVSIEALVLGLAAWIGAMALARKNAPIERGVSLGSAWTATLSSLALMALAVPAALGGQGWGSIPTFDTPDLFHSPTRLDLDLDLRQSLNQNSDSPVFLYLSDGSRPDAFRLYTLTDFDGDSWSYEAPDPTTRPATVGLLWPEPIPGWTESNRVRLDVSILSLSTDHLPVPTSPRTVSVTGDWTYDLSTDSIIGDKENTRDLSYTIVTSLFFHNAQTLRATDGLLAENPGLDAADPAVFRVAPSVDLASVRALADQLTEGKTTRYDKTLAIQNYLRNPSIFTYTTEIDPAPGDSVSAFLAAKEGYCLQFATAMVIMLRSLGIPARLGYGFLAGSFDGANGYVVRGEDAHVWPEVYFPTHGWVRFEPTPSVQAGAPPSWADPFSGTSVLPVPREVLEGGSYPVGPRPNGPVTPNDPSAADDSPFLPSWAIRTIAVLASLALFAGILLVRRRITSTERALHGPEGAWQRLADRLGDLSWPSSATPLEARLLVLRGIERLGGLSPTQQGTDALVHLSSAVSDHRYAPEGTAATQQQLDLWVAQVIAEAERVTEGTTGRPVRGGARSGPRDGA